MSALCAAFGDDPRRVWPAAMLLRASPDDARALWHDAEAALGLTRPRWALTPGLGGPVLLSVEPDVVVACDAVLYYRDDLARALAAAGVPAAGDAPAQLVAAAYRAWGDSCLSHLEGDVAFVLWDRARRRMVAGRDFVGRRALHWAELPGGRLVVASSAAAVRAHPDCPADLDLAAIAETAAGLLGASGSTGWRAVRVLPAGHVLVRDDTGRVHLRRAWEPPVFESARRPAPIADAAMELRELLVRATLERAAPDGPTAVWMSGGWDSTAVFAAGREARRRAADARPIVPVSISYPVGDPGREDELIAAVAEHWGATPHWIHSRDIPLLDADPRARAAERDGPVVHVYEHWNGALMDGARAAGARVALDGVGGDALFQVGRIFLADLCRRGRWMRLAREWRAFPPRARDWRTLFRWTVQPNLPAPMLGMARALRGGRPLRHYMQRALPDWMDAAFVRRHDLAARVALPMVRRPGESLSAVETQWYLVTPWQPTLLSGLQADAVRRGLEIRSPLCDERVVRHAATRPWTDRAGGGETKRLLRAAMRGLLPDHVLAPRPSRTGLTSGFLRERMREALPALVERDLAAPVLAEAGIVDPERLRAAAAGYLRAPNDALGVLLFFTLQAEWWLRARTRGSAGAHRAPAPAAAGGR